MPNIPKDESPEAKEKRLASKRIEGRRYRAKHRDQILARQRRRLSGDSPAAERRREVSREASRQWRLENPEKQAETGRRYRNAPAVREHNRVRKIKYNLEHRDRVRAQSREYWKALAADPVRVAENYAKRKARALQHPEEAKAAYRRSVLRRRATKFALQLMERGELTRLVRRLAGNRLPPFGRGEVEAAIAIDLLERRLDPREIEDRFGEYVAAYNRQYDTHRTLSLDTVIPGTQGLRWIDQLEAAEPFTEEVELG